MEQLVTEKFRDYELVLSFPPSEEEKNSYVSSIDKMLAKYDVQNIEKEDWGTKKVFHIKKYPTLHMFYVLFSSVPDSIAKITKELNLSQNIVKYFLAKKTEKKQRKNK